MRQSLSRYPDLVLLMIAVHLMFNLAGKIVPIDGYYYMARRVLFRLTALVISQLRSETPVVEMIPGWSRDLSESLKEPATVITSLTAATEGAKR